MTMKATDFVKKLYEIEKKETTYLWGSFLNKKENGKLCSDCSGLVKGVLWGYPNAGKYASNGVPDVNANTIIKKYCTKTGTPDSAIPVGSFLWMDGHCGIYLGNNQVMESTPIWKNGVQITKLSARKWLKYGLLKWIDYSKSDIYDYLAIAKEVVRGIYGNGHTKRKQALEKIYPEIDYEKVRSLVNNYYKNGKW